MTRTVATALLLSVALVLSGCSGGWFGRSRQAPPPEQAADVNPLLPKKADKVRARAEAARGGPAIETVTSLVIERTAHGAIIRAEGIAARQGAYDARLVADDPAEGDPSGVLSYTFRVYYPDYATPVGAEATRRIAVARNISEQTLEGMRLIRVKGRANARESRRR